MGGSTRCSLAKYRRRFAGFDDKIIVLYARGMSAGEIAEHIGELYGIEISPELVSAVTDLVLAQPTPRLKFHFSPEQPTTVKDVVDHPEDSA